MWTLVSSSARVYISRDLFNAPKSVIDVDNGARFITKSWVCETLQSSVDNMFVSELNIRGRLMNMFRVLYDDAFIERALLNGVCVLNAPSSRSCSSAAWLQTNNCQVIRVCSNKMIYLAPPWSPRSVSEKFMCVVALVMSAARKANAKGGRDGCKWEWQLCLGPVLLCGSLVM